MPSDDDQPRFPTWALIVAAFIVLGVWGYLHIQPPRGHGGPPWEIDVMALSVIGSLFSSAFMRNLARVVRRVLDEMDKENPPK